MGFREDAMFSQGNDHEHARINLREFKLINSLAIEDLKAGRWEQKIIMLMHTFFFSL
jgi:hypothetical protein